LRYANGVHYLELTYLGQPLVLAADQISAMEKYPSDNSCEIYTKSGQMFTVAESVDQIFKMLEGT
jgi:uncharacterized protein YlzI (FlbEa/FlbD family)